MEFDVLGLRAANIKCKVARNVESAEDVCIESRASVMAFIDDCTWVGQIVESEKRLVHSELEEAQRVLAEVIPTTAVETQVLKKLKESLSKRCKQVLEFKVEIPASKFSKPERPEINVHSPKSPRSPKKLATPQVPVANAGQ